MNEKSKIDDIYIKELKHRDFLFNYQKELWKGWTKDGKKYAVTVQIMIDQYHSELMRYLYPETMTTATNNPSVEKYY